MRMIDRVKALEVKFGKRVVERARDAFEEDNGINGWDAMMDNNDMLFEVFEGYVIDLAIIVDDHIKG